MRANVADLEGVLLRQIVMRDVSVRDPSVEVLGQRLALPIVLAPVGLAGMFARRAEVQAARARRHGRAVRRVDRLDLRHRGGGGGDQDSGVVPAVRDARPRLRGGPDGAAHAVGSPVLVLTIDLAVVGARHRDTRNAVVGHPSAWAKVPSRAGHRGPSSLDRDGGARRAAADLRQPGEGGSRRRARRRRSGSGSTRSSIRA